MRLFTIKFQAKCADMVFDDQLVVPGKTPAEARLRFEDLVHRAPALLGCPSGFTTRVIYPQDCCQITVKKVETLDMNKKAGAAK